MYKNPSSLFHYSSLFPSFVSNSPDLIPILWNRLSNIWVAWVLAWRSLFPHFFSNYVIGRALWVKAREGEKAPDVEGRDLPFGWSWGLKEEEQWGLVHYLNCINSKMWLWSESNSNSKFYSCILNPLPHLDPLLPCRGNWWICSFCRYLST